VIAIPLENRFRNEQLTPDFGAGRSAEEQTVRESFVLWSIFFLRMIIAAGLPPSSGSFFASPLGQLVEGGQLFPRLGRVHHQNVVARRARSPENTPAPLPS